MAKIGHFHPFGSAINVLGKLSPRFSFFFLFLQFQSLVASIGGGAGYMACIAQFLALVSTGRLGVRGGYGAGYTACKFQFLAWASVGMLVDKVGMV